MPARDALGKKEDDHEDLGPHEALKIDPKSPVLGLGPQDWKSEVAAAGDEGEKRWCEEEGGAPTSRPTTNRKLRRSAQRNL